MLRISVEDFYKLSPKEFYYALKAKREEDTAKIELDIKQRYEVARFQAMLVINPTLKRGNQLKDPKDLIVFSWEKDEKEGKQSIDEMKAVMMGVARRQNRKSKKEK